MHTSATSRRALLTGIPIVGAGLALGACHSFTSSPLDLSGAAKKASAIASAVTGFLPELAAAAATMAGATAASSAKLVAKMGAWAADLQKGAASIATATADGAKTVVGQFEAILRALLADAAALPLPTSWHNIVAAIQSIVPLIEAAVGLVSIAMAAPAPGSEDEAMAVLAAAARGH